MRQVPWQVVTLIGSLGLLGCVEAHSDVDTGIALDTAADRDTDTDTDSQIDTDADTDTDVEDTDTDTDVQDTDTDTAPVGVIFSEDFEGSAAGTVPDGWDDFVGWVVNGGNNRPDRETFALADGGRVYSGARALHAVGGSNPAQIAHPLPEGTDRVYVRARIWSTEQLGASPGRNHETLIALRARSGSVSDEVRFGEIKGVIGTNEVPSDDISPRYESWGTGPIVAAGAWHCIEVAFLADRTPHELRAWSNGDLIHEITEPSQWNNRVLGGTFLQGKFGEVVLGWHSFSGLTNELWIDDVVVATERVGCRAP